MLLKADKGMGHHQGNGVFGAGAQAFHQLFQRLPGRRLFFMPERRGSFKGRVHRLKVQAQRGAFRRKGPQAFGRLPRREKALKPCGADQAELPDQRNAALSAEAQCQFLFPHYFRLSIPARASAITRSRSFCSSSAIASPAARQANSGFLERYSLPSQPR